MVIVLPSRVVHVRKQDAEADAARLPQPSVRRQLPSATFGSLRRAAHEGNVGLLVWDECTVPLTKAGSKQQQLPSTTW